MQDVPSGSTEDSPTRQSIALHQIDYLRGLLLPARIVPIAALYPRVLCRSVLARETTTCAPRSWTASLVEVRWSSPTERLRAPVGFVFFWPFTAPAGQWRRPTDPPAQCAVMIGCTGSCGDRRQQFPAAEGAVVPSRWGGRSRCRRAPRAMPRAVPLPLPPHAPTAFASLAAHAQLHTNPT